MQPVPVPILAQFDAILEKRSVAPIHRAAYKKWLRYFLDFIIKYPFPQSRPDQVRQFIDKLRKKRQTPTQQNQAAHAVFLYFEMPHKEIGFRKSRMLFFFFSILVGIFSLALPARAALIFLDDFEGDSLNAVITYVVRTPTVGPPDSAGWVSPHGAVQVRVVPGFDKKAAFVDTPQGSSLDYLGRLDGSHGNNIFLITWDIEVATINGGWGMFLIRFPRSNDPLDMQVLFGFRDDGRLIRFSGEPLADNLLPVGYFQPGLRYSVWFIYDLVSSHYTVSLNGVTVVDREPIPGYLAVSGINKFDFDLNQRMDLPDHPPQGNTYYVDNIRFATLESIYLPILLRDH